MADRHCMRPAGVQRAAPAHNRVGDRGALEEAALVGPEFGRPWNGTSQSSSFPNAPAEAPAAAPFAVTPRSLQVPGAFVPSGNSTSALLSAVPLGGRGRR